jgi:glycosyltransferase involved in cell wall biosynthesis
VARVLWLAGGLAPVVTGIERIVLSLADRLLETELVAPSDFLVESDPGSELRSELRDRGLRCVDPGSAAGVGRADSANLVHNFGRTLRWSRGTGSYLFSVWDWGPFRDRAVPVKARLGWSGAITLGHARATDVHYLNRSLPDQRPRVVPAPHASLVCFAETVGTMRLGELAEPRHALFVGTATPRKRLDLLSRLAPQVGLPVVLAGQWTDAFASPYVEARGRVSESELEDLLAHAACILLLSSYEGFGLPILEGARRGLHSVVSPEVLEILPDSLRSFCHPVHPLTGDALAAAVAEATAARGTARFDEDLLEPLMEYYTERLGRC